MIKVMVMMFLDVPLQNHRSSGLGARWGNSPPLPYHLTTCISLYVNVLDIVLSVYSLYGRIYM